MNEADNTDELVRQLMPSWRMWVRHFDGTLAAARQFVSIRMYKEGYKVVDTVAQALYDATSPTNKDT